MNNQVRVPQEIHSYLWTRYLPETAYKTYILIGYLQQENKTGKVAMDFLLNANIKEENTIPQILQEKKDVLKKLGYEYPKNIKEDLDLLLSFQLIMEVADSKGDTYYIQSIPVPKLEEVLKLDDEEIKNLKNIRFEIDNQKGMDMILTMLLNGNGNLGVTLDYIYKTTKVKLTEIRAVLSYLVDEGSISNRANKAIDKLKKEDNLLIQINEAVFHQKRVVL